MSAVLASNSRMTAEDYLAWDEAQETRHEYLAGAVFAMTGGTQNHNLINGNIFAELRESLRGQPCRVFFNDLRLHVEAANAYFYPDVLVTCDPRDLANGRAIAVQHAWLVAEVLSDSTAAYDRGAKFERYRSLPTLTHYLLVETTRPHADLFRKNDQGLWVLHPLDLGDRLRTGEPHGLDIAINALYDGIAFDPSPATE